MLAINIAMVFAIIRLTKRTNDNMNKFFLGKTGDFYPAKEEVVEDNQNTETKVEVIEKTSKEYVVNDVDDTTYRSSSFKNEYKNIKEEMSFDREDVILDVIENSDKEVDKHSEAIRKINESFDFDTIFELSTIPTDKQLAILNDAFDEEQKKFLNNYLLNNRNFDVAQFFNYVKEQAKLIDEKYYVKTGWRDDDFNDIGDNVVTVHDEDIVEGIQVVHKNKMYDYSL